METMDQLELNRDVMYLYNKNNNKFIKRHIHRVVCGALHHTITLCRPTQYIFINNTLYPVLGHSNSRTDIFSNISFNIIKQISAI